ncbi:hypothetical protein HID58_095766 [Brassica napus]|uniref:Serine/threonine protein phosphatase 2A regulatory subunit n=1 Tax=Brassica napus TaxID=3708 RepID=A0ABQ7X4X0_BRANA|nr:hypothetical protein HID58_095766 [Brassica napus]
MLAMWKQILSKLPNKKSSKNEHHHRGGREHGGHSSSSSSSHASTSKSSDNGVGKTKHSQTKERSTASSDVNPKSIANNNNGVFTPYEALPNPTKNIKEKDIKRQTLLELVDYVNSANGKFSEGSVQEVVRMVSANIFRTLNPQPRENKVIDALDLEEEEPSMDLAWPHLQLVYELFLRFVASPETDTKLAKRYIDQSFVLRLLDLFDSEDLERGTVSKQSSTGSTTEKHNGIAEFLEILGNIINGFALPLKKSTNCLMHHAVCEKDCKLADTVIRGLLKYWPVTNIGGSAGSNSASGVPAVYGAAVSPDSSVFEQSAFSDTGKLPKKPSSAAKFWDSNESQPPDNNNQGEEVLPRLRDVPISEKQELFLKKLRLCCVVFDFVSEPQLNLKEKEIKRQTLLEVVDYVISSGNAKFPEQVIQEATKMVSANLFSSNTHQQCKNKTPEGLDLEEEQEGGSLNPSWPHLQIVYEFLLRLVASPNTDAKISKKYIDPTFVLKLLDLFDSEDHREREYLKTILHRIYGRFMVHRPFIRKTMNNILYDFILETGKHSGIAEFLEVLGSIINGFALPLKEEHKLFLTRVLVPLHKLKCLPNYHQQLSYCVIQFVEKDCKLADTVIRGLLKYWPVTNSSKEIMFLNELEEILESTQGTEFERCMVAERALYLWNNDHVSSLVRQNSRIILPIVLPALEKNGSSHWNQAVKNLTDNVLKVLSDTNPELFEECLRKFQEDQQNAEDNKKKNGETWRQLEEIVASKGHTSMEK